MIYFAGVIAFKFHLLTIQLNTCKVRVKEKVQGGTGAIL